MTTIGIPSTRVSEVFVRQQLLNQVRANQVDLYKLESQLSTGHSILLPSDDPVIANRVMSIQRLQERNAQVQSNLNTSSSYLSATDSALSEVSSLMSEVRGNALSVIGTTATADQRMAAAQQVSQALQQLVDTGNQNFRGRYLFAGSLTDTMPFVSKDGIVRYNGNESRVASYASTNLLFDTNLDGNEVFGAISEPVRGSVDVNPTVSAATPLTDLFGGKGITKGSITISDGTTKKTIDLSQAETVGDVAKLIHANPPTGKTLDVDITPKGLVIHLDSGSLTIDEVGGGSTASELGILRRAPQGATPITSSDLDPRVTATTKLSDILGAPATVFVRSLGGDNDIIVQGDHNGADLNGVTVSYVDDGSVQAGHETVSYDPVGKTLVVHVKDGYTEARQVVAAINAAHTAGTVPFTAKIDSLDETFGGTGLIDSAVTPPVVTAYGSGATLDRNSGLKIENGNQTFTIDVSQAVTVEDFLNVLNNSPAGVLAQINDTGTGIDVRSRISGADFAIGENGGQTATQLGLRTFTSTTNLASMNFGQGVGDYQGPGVKANATLDSLAANSDLIFEAVQEGAQWNGYTVNVIDGAGPLNVNWNAAAKQVNITIDTGVTTANDVIAAFNSTPGLKDVFRASSAVEFGKLSTGAGVVSAGTVVSGSGSLTNTDFVITRNDGVALEIDVHGAKTIGDVLNLINNNADNLGSGVPLVARLAADGNGIELLDNNAGAGRLTVTKAVSSSAAIDLALIPKGKDSASATTSGALPDVLTGSDTNPQETSGLFTALLRLQQGLIDNDLGEMQRAIGMLDESTKNMNFARAELGSREQSLDVLKDRLTTQVTELKVALSNDYDVDVTQVISDFMSRQTAYQASLKSVAAISKLTLLDYL